MLVFLGLTQNVIVMNLAKHEQMVRKIEITKHMFYKNKRVHTFEPLRSSSEDDITISPSRQPSKLPKRRNFCAVRCVMEFRVRKSPNAIAYLQSW
jgi:hypothetical protein